MKIVAEILLTALCLFGALNVVKGTIDKSGALNSTNYAGSMQTIDNALITSSPLCPRNISIKNAEDLKTKCKQLFYKEEIKNRLLDYNGGINIIKFISLPFCTLGNLCGYTINYALHVSGILGQREADLSFFI